MCYTTANRYFGPHSQLLTQKDADEDIVECTGASAVKYTERVGRLYPQERQYYAPLLFLVDAETEAPILIKSCFVLLTNPLTLGNAIANWRESGVDIPDYEVHIVENDRDFDVEVSKAFLGGIGVVIDPLFDRSGELIRGYVVRQLGEAMNSLGAADGYHK
jgi:hypothetical protein